MIYWPEIKQSDWSIQTSHSTSMIRQQLVTNRLQFDWLATGYYIGLWPAVLGQYSNQVSNRGNNNSVHLYMICQLVPAMR